jgi:hypothetical protein
LASRARKRFSSSAKATRPWLWTRMGCVSCCAWGLGRKRRAIQRLIALFNNLLNQE